jgi:aspartate/methionine/tyrosine aminotransferase
MAALAAVSGPQDVVAAMRDAYRERRDRALEVLRAGELPVLTPKGAFYLWVDIGAAARRSDAFVRELIEHRGVAVAPGTAFGSAGDSFVRLSLAADLEYLLEGSRRLIEQVRASG